MNVAEALSISLVDRAFGVDSTATNFMYSSPSLPVTGLLDSFVPPFGTTMIGLTHGVGPSTFSTNVSFQQFCQLFLHRSSYVVMNAPYWLCHGSYIPIYIELCLEDFQLSNAFKTLRIFCSNILPCINSSHKTDSKNTQLFCGISSK